MALHVIAGKGPVGTATARALVAAGHTVRVLSRSGGTPAEGIEHRALDVTDADALTTAARGADVLYNAVNPAYPRWATDWPPLAAALLTAAERTGAVLVAAGNLYPHGRPTGPMTARSPLAATDVKGRVRARVWTDMLAAHEAGRVRVSEARASDFVGPVPADHSHLVRQLPSLRAGRRAWVVGDPDALHSWTYVSDLAATLVVLGADERAWGRPWTVPSQPPRSQCRALTDLAAAMGAPPARVTGIPWPALRALGVAVPQLREVVAIRHQWDGDFVLDASETTDVLGLVPTGWDEAVAATVTARP